MKKLAWAVFLFCALAWGAWAAEPPAGLAGVVLGAELSKFKDKVRMETLLPLRYLDNVKEVEIKPLPGIRTGLVAFGACGEKDRVLRIKLKLADSSREFFDDLLERYKEKFGDPDQYKGDPFHLVIAWKWSFTAANGHKISLILQHNALDDDEAIGNIVKLTDWSLLMDQRACKGKSAPRPKAPPVKPKAVDWGLLVPK